ncbi:hypothetical protein WYO_3678 [Methylobacterium sp. GXF4]|uniref:hypothetical protein n=1 Tax=Methylobacterium sp. GXF4 TaxID=1096546 RepID=UPI0002697CEC|nr:hypothetical protein [Methylobacterium sp. GXF4]EIZ83665.1 hypothetical protein WYO_3678 [Methylobacterium sp. GXF4]
MRPIRFHVLRLLEWVAQLDEARANARIRSIVAFRNRRADDAKRYGTAADAICPPAEWNPRLWDRDQDPRTDTRERRP